MDFSPINIVRKIKFKYSENVITEEGCIPLFWYKERVNLGDYINSEIVSFVSGKKVQWVPSSTRTDYCMAIGSVVQLATDKTTIWGAGLINERLLPIKKPKHIFAVRGPLTRNRLVAAGIDCPAVYGDPALLLPKLYMPNSELRKYKIGIIPHYVDKNNDFFNRAVPDWIKVIDIENPNYKDFVDDLIGCEVEISSSLHGLIIADA